MMKIRITSVFVAFVSFQCFFYIYQHGTEKMMSLLLKAQAGLDDTVRSNIDITSNRADKFHNSSKDFGVSIEGAGVFLRGCKSHGHFNDSIVPKSEALEQYFCNSLKKKVKIDDKEIQREGNTNTTSNTTSNNKRNDAEKRADPPELDQKIDEDTNSEKISEFEFYNTIHNSEFPAEKAGEWTYRPDARANNPSKEHLSCLDQERQGNCHDPDAWKNTNDTAKLSRYKSMAAKAIANSPGILSGYDPWMWQSKMQQYRVLEFKDRDFYARQVGKALNNRTLYLVGDSLTRQWSQSMRCELIHVLGMSPKDANKKVRYVQVHHGVGDIREKTFDQTEEQDIVVFNIGHHVGFKIGSNWTKLYRAGAGADIFFRQHS